MYLREGFCFDVMMWIVFLGELGWFGYIICWISFINLVWLLKLLYVFVFED